jgi:integrase
MGFSLKEIQEWLGHADISITADIYGHLDVKRKQTMADKLGETFGTRLEKALEISDN